MKTQRSSFVTSDVTMMRNCFFSLAFCIVLGGCAKSYRPLAPERRVYTNYHEDDSLVFRYRYNVLRESGNIRYSKKELKKGMHIVSVKIENHTNRDLIIGQDINFYMNDSRLDPLDLPTVHRYLKQSPYPYLLYLLLLPTPATGNGKRTRVDPQPWEYALGPGLAAFNIVVVMQANKRFKDELTRYNLIGKEIKAGETVYGLVGFPYLGYDPLTLHLKD